VILAHDPPKYNPDRLAKEPEPVEVVDLRIVDQPTLCALLSLRIGGLVVHGVALRYRRGRLCVVLPAWRDQAVEAVSPALKAALNDTVIEAWKVATAFRGGGR